MKRFLALALLISAQPALYAGLLSHWTFDETTGATTVADSGPNNVTGTIAGGAGFTAGRFGNAIQLNSSLGQFVNFGNVYDFTGADFSISAWIKTTSTSAELIAGRHFAGYFNGYFLASNAGSGYGSPNTAYFYPSGAPGEEAISTSTVNDGQWHLVVGVYSAGNISIFVDSGAAEQTKNVGAPGTSPADFIVGGLNAFGTNVAAYNGLVDDVRVYSHALTQSEIEALYDPQAAVPEPASVSMMAASAVAALVARRRLRR